MLALPLLLSLVGFGSSESLDAKVYALEVSGDHPLSLRISQERTALIKSIKVLAGEPNPAAYQASPISTSDDSTDVQFDLISDTIARIQIEAPSAGYIGAQFSRNGQDHNFGVWSYPWNGSLTNDGVSFEVKGTQELRGTNYCNARAPFYISSAGYGVYVDTLQMGKFDFSDSEKTEFVFNSTSLSFYIILPESPRDVKSILTQYGKLSSTIFMPPDSAFGPVIFADDWNEAFAEPDLAVNNYLNVTDHLYANQIRASSLFADRPYGTGNGSWGNFDFNRTNYPEPKEFIDQLYSMGYDFQVWASNRATPGTLLWNVSVANDWQFEYDPLTIKGGLEGPALNLSIPEAYDWFKEQMEYFPSVDVRGYKIDRGEEEEMPVWEQNIQMGLMTKMLHEHMVEAWGEGVIFNFARSANDRSRSHTAVWGGDSHANFTGLEYSIASGIRAGLVGFAMWGSDTGGYIRKPEEQIPPVMKQPPTEEVFARWMHFSVFSPMYELLLGEGGTPWFDYSQDLVDIFAETAALHHELLPYIRSHIYGAHTHGLPVIRALFIEHPEDEMAWTEVGNTEFFFGEGFFVAPVIAEGGKREVYFPGDESVEYIDYGTRTKMHRGGETAWIEVDLHDSPVFVKAGSIIPRGDVFQANAQWEKDWSPYLNVEIFPSWSVPKSTFAYYNRDADKVVDITVEADRCKKQVKVRYGPLGHTGSILVYTKTGVESIELDPEGGVAVVRGIESLFE